MAYAAKDGLTKHNVILYPPSWRHSAPQDEGRAYVTAAGWAALIVGIAGVVAGLTAAVAEEKRRSLIIVCAVLTGFALILGVVATPNPSSPAGSAESTEQRATASSPELPSPQASATSSSPQASTTSAVVTTPEGPPTGLRTYLADLDPIVGGWMQETTLILQTRAFSIDGVGYEKGLSREDCFGRDGSETATYELNGDYAQFETTVGMTDYTDETWRSRIDFVIGNTVIASQEVQRGVAPIPVEFSVDGAFSLSIITTTLGGNAGCGGTVPNGPSLGDPELIS